MLIMCVTHMYTSCRHQYMFSVCHVETCAVVCCVVIVGEHVTVVILTGGEMASDLASLCLMYTMTGVHNGAAVRKVGAGIAHTFN